MDDTNPIKDIVYQFIDEYTEKKIQSELSKGKSQHILDSLISKCIEKIIRLEGNKEENIGKFAESTLHYFLTVLMISSQRKISLDDTDIDIVIPDLKTLKETPENALIIYFPKTTDQNKIQKQILKLSKIQPVNDNIWIVLSEKLQTNLRSYIINLKEKTFTNILENIREFEKTKKNSKFKIFRN